MFSYLLISGLILTACLILLINHPPFMGILLLLFSLMIAVLSGSISSNFWFSYILFLIFVGGLLVLFTYMTSLTSNEIFTPPKIIFTVVIFSVLLTLLPLLFMHTLNWQTSPILNYTNLLDPLSKLYLGTTYHLTMFLAIYLLLMLIIVVFLTKLNQGPLRSFLTYV